MKLGRYLSSLTKTELESMREGLNLSDDERPIFEELSHGRSIVAVADRCNCATSTVSNRVRTIVTKIERYRNE